MLRFSYVTDAWKIESAAELLCAWDVADDETLLDDLIQRVMQR